MPALIYYMAVLLALVLSGNARPAAGGSFGRPLFLDGTFLSGAKGDSISLAVARRPVGKSVPDVSEDTTDAVRQGLREGEFPWYDSGADRLRPVWAPRNSWAQWLQDRFDGVVDAISRFFKSLGMDFAPGGGAGGVRSDWLGTTLLATVLIAFFVFLLVIWLRGEPFASGGGAARARPGSAQLLAQLTGNSVVGLDDPWAEAQRRRLAGDYAGAIIYLFAHQLISLDRAGLIRLAPGWTARQYVRWLRDPVLVDSLSATLGLFEEIYYGHRLPSQSAFEHAWGRAQALEDRRIALERSR